MDRSLNGDDFRLFQRWEREDHPERFPAPTLDSLPGWFLAVLREQAIFLGCEAIYPELFADPTPADLGEAA
ncbi:MAG: hypothetical protein E6J29_07635 [Chloroflexi bacterium]|nr:MAG: hypothetical protein E6J29_07635 [Chloroflexota bacterium]TMD53767.1 MAG: hypothetical protein E6I85_07705 [Chloroflexota bacterium]